MESALYDSQETLIISRHLKELENTKKRHQ